MTTCINSVLSRPSIPRDSSGTPLYENVSKAANLGGNLLGVLIPGAAGVIFGSLDAIIPGHNVPDAAAKIGTYGSFGLAGYFLYRVWKLIKKDKQADARHPTPIKLHNETLVKDIGNSIAKVSANSDEVLKLSQNIINGKSDDSIIPEARNLFRYWTDNDIKNIVIGNEGRSEFVFDNGNGIKSPINLSDLKDRLAVLIGYTVGTKDLPDPFAVITATNPGGLSTADTILTNSLKLSDIEDGKKFELDHLVPDEFAIVYSVARHYKTRHDLFTNDLISTSLPEIGTEAKIKSLRADLKQAKGSPLEEAARDHLMKGTDSFICNYNYLKVLQQSIEYVIKAENDSSSGKLTAGRVRNAAVLKAALIAGLELKIPKTDTDLSITEQLKRILGGYDSNPPTGLGSKKGVSAKADELEKLLAILKEPSEGSVSINVTEEATKDKTYGNIFSYPKDEFIVFNGLIKELATSS